MKRLVAVSWFLFVWMFVNVVNAQVLCGQLGTALNCIGPDSRSTIIAPSPVVPNTGMLITEDGMQPYQILTPPASRFDPAPLPTLDPLPTRPSYEVAPPLYDPSPSVPTYESPSYWGR